MTLTYSPAVAWLSSDAPVAYPEALAFMETRAGEIADGKASEAVWLLEHPPLYTAGTSAKAADLLDDGGFPVYATGRGGQYTYHGPGQRVGYTMLDVKARGGDIRRFVRSLEEWLILTLARLGVTGERREGRVGIWVVDPVTGAEDKIAALGIRIRRGVSFHGVSLNVDPDLTHFAGIVPCGISQYGVTSLKRLGKTTAMADVDAALKTSFAEVFGG